MLGFVDDTLSIQKCGELSRIKNAASNAFVNYINQNKKEDKTNYIHIGNKNKCLTTCPELYVNEVKMKQTMESKYLGCMISVKSSIKSIIEMRRKKVWRSSLL